ncbi:MAG TPA: HAD family hydrolase [Nitrososphaeraceae archaeon]|jgi:putative hydrolase of the HAD superfamily
MRRLFIFFDLGQTLVNEWNFIHYFDQRFLELLNGYGARIDERNYQTVRDNIVRNRMIGFGGINELILEVCRLVCHSNYESLIMKKLGPELKEMRTRLFRLTDYAEDVIEELIVFHRLGIIANQPTDILELLRIWNVDRFFDIKVLSSLVRMAKPSPEIFKLALMQASYDPENCVMVGDRLDTDISPANKLGMKTIRITDSIFKMQEPINKYENPTYTIAKLCEIPRIIDCIR